MALIIGGHYRSGTTLMATLCDRHPEMRMTFEFRCFYAINTSYPRHMRWLRKDWYVRGMLHEASRRKWRNRLPSGWLVANYALRLLPYATQRIGVAQIEPVLHQLLPGARIVGDKVPRYVLRLDALAREPGLKRLIIYRDGRDVTSSMLGKFRGPWRSLPMARELDSAGKIAQHWVRTIEAMEKHRASLHCVCYEDLVRRPRETLDAVAHWLDVDPAGFQDDLVSDISIGRYRTDLTPHELAQVEEAAGPVLARLGYT